MTHKFSSESKLYQANPEAWYLLIVNQTMPRSSTNKNFTLFTVKEIYGKSQFTTEKITWESHLLDHNKYQVKP